MSGTWDLPGPTPGALPASCCRGRVDVVLTALPGPSALPAPVPLLTPACLPSSVPASPAALSPAGMRRRTRYQGTPGPRAPPSWAQLGGVELTGHLPDFTLSGAQSEQCWGGRRSRAVLPTSPASLFSLGIFSHCVPLSVSKATVLWTCYGPQSLSVKRGRSNLQSFSWSFAAFDRAVGRLLVGCSSWSSSLLQQRDTSTMLESSQSIPRTTSEVPSVLEAARAAAGLGGSCWFVAFRRGCG